MKNFKLMGLSFECDDCYSHAAMDEDGSFWVYTEDPFTSTLEWDTKGEMHQVFPITYESNDTNWNDSKIEI